MNASLYHVTGKCKCVPCPAAVYLAHDKHLTSPVHKDLGQLRKALDQLLGAKLCFRKIHFAFQVSTYLLHFYPSLLKGAMGSIHSSQNNLVR